MNDEARKTLREIVDTYGQSVVDDPRRCKALLLDYCSQYRREIFVLNIAQEERVAKDLQEAKGALPLPVLMAQLTQRLVDNRALAEDAARWAVEAWGYALRLSDGESSSRPDVGVPAVESPPPPPVSPPPSTRTEPPPPPPPGKPKTPPSVTSPTRTFTSRHSIEVYGRRSRPSNSKWQKLGVTPGSVTIPWDYVIGLRFLNFTEQELESWINEVQNPSNVISLAFSGRVNDAGMAALRAFSNLVYLEIENAESITNAGMAHLVYVPHLTTFHLGWSTGTTDTGLAYVRLLPDLMNLHLPWSGISDAALPYLETLTKLSTLELRECKHIKGTGLSCLRATKDLTTLDLAGMTQLSDSGLQHIAACKALTKLDLARCPQLTMKGVMYLRDLANLTYLDLSRNAQIEDKSAAILCALPQLATLNLARTAITDVGLSHIGDITSLLYLDLSYCELITDKGLAYLRHLPKLAYLNVEGCKRITQRGLAKLSRPDLYVIH